MNIWKDRIYVELTPEFNLWKTRTFTANPNQVEYFGFKQRKIVHVAWIKVRIFKF